MADIIGDLIECGLSVLHPIQKHTMDWQETARQWKGKVAFLVGMDVQDTLINASPEAVRREVRLMRDTFDSPAGGFLYAAGNGIARAPRWKISKLFWRNAARMAMLKALCSARSVDFRVAQHAIYAVGTHEGYAPSGARSAGNG